jgi:hypothetical protein
MFEDGNWKRKIGKKDQIIALTTKLTKMQAKFDQQIASFATHNKKGIHSYSCIQWGQGIASF